MSESTVAFLEKLSNRTTKGIQEELGKRQMHTGNMIRKLVKSLESVLQRGQDIADMVQSGREKVLSSYPFIVFSFLFLLELSRL